MKIGILWLKRLVYEFKFNCNSLIVSNNEVNHILYNQVFERLQLDYPVNPIGYIGTFLLGAKDHTVAEQSYIAKAIKCYNYVMFWSVMRYL